MHVWEEKSELSNKINLFLKIKSIFYLLFNSIIKYLIMLVLKGVGVLTCQFGITGWKSSHSLHVRYCSIINS